MHRTALEFYDIALIHSIKENKISTQYYLREAACYEVAALEANRENTDGIDRSQIVLAKSAASLCEDAGYTNTAKRICEWYLNEISINHHLDGDGHIEIERDDMIEILDRIKKNQ